MPVVDRPADQLLDERTPLDEAAARLLVHGLVVQRLQDVGGCLSAASSDPMFDPAALAEAGVVVVTVNCRVGAEGFAFLDDAPPNRGFLNQIAALEWVQLNISAFDGDPGRVTVAGVSAGAG